ncbi:hypothetical protein LEP1GSC050_0060 [Leptospira phage vB_LbrZ_5399-LE1]|nr:hypothetical protein LEP1GSC050_0060 [Leptospira phage vB_LbrZ_5399-LE1]AGS80809.1 hypothetical protein LEP1GSC047_0909 [Leptospira phage vB_LinZ_10-LE1]
MCSQIVHHLIESGNVKNANLQEKLLLGEKPNGVYNFEESGNWFFRFVKSAERKKRLINLVYYILIAAPVLYGLYKLLKD